MEDLRDGVHHQVEQVAAAQPVPVAVAVVAQCVQVDKPEVSYSLLKPFVGVQSSFVNKIASNILYFCLLS